MEVNQIICGDCLEVMPNIPDKSIDMILCDLPYGTTACKWDVIIPFEPLWTQYKRIIKDNGAIVLTASQPFTSALVMSNLKMFKYDIVWSKNLISGWLNAKKRFLVAHESILIFYKNQPIFNPIKVKRTEKSLNRLKYKHEIHYENDYEGYGNTKYIYKTNDKEYSYPKSILSINKTHKESGFHPTQKPVALFEYLIKTYTNKGDLVLDNCAGSGTTGVACKNLGRNFILIEKEEKYCEIARNRIKAIPESLF